MSAGNLAARMAAGGLSAWAGIVDAQLDAFFRQSPHGDWPRWQAAIDALSGIAETGVQGDVSVDDGAFRVGSGHGLADSARQALKASLQALHPWRKGPYELFGVRIDTEWRSDWKWDRLAADIEPLDGRLVLDVGCGNGYHCWRMGMAGARHVIGIDPTAVFVAQFLAVQQLVHRVAPSLAGSVDLLPVGIEAMPAAQKGFDTVFSMGVLYHRRSPIDHLLELRDALRPGGQLVLETLVIDGAGSEVLVPPGRYAKMRNVWFLPTTGLLQTWLARCGFREIATVDVTPTTTAEQRSTEWMRFESLADYLSPDHPGQTVEGHPAPRRAILTAFA
jgi:tRNA (mo5U34)-methyltransferase